MKMTCAAIDDEPMALDILEEYISKTPFLEMKGSFRNAVEGLAFLQEEQVSLLFLDINMPDLTGIELLKSLQKPPMVIFTTAYPDYALQGFELQAVDYLLKPIELPRFLMACNKAFELYQLKSQESTLSPQINSKAQSEESIFVKSGTVNHKINLKSLSHLEGMGNYVAFMVDGKKILGLMKMTEAEALLPQYFMRIHKSYIVNLQQIETYEKHQLTVQGITIPIGVSYRDAFQERLKNF